MAYVVPSLLVAAALFALLVAWLTLRVRKPAVHRLCVLDERVVRENVVGLGQIELAPGQRGTLGFTYQPADPDEIPEPKPALSVRSLCLPSWSCDGIVVEQITIEPHGGDTLRKALPAEVFSEVSLIGYHVRELGRVSPGQTFRLRLRNTGRTAVNICGAVRCRSLHSPDQW